MSGGTSRSSGSHGRSTPTAHVLSLYPHTPKTSSQSAPGSSPALTPRALLQRHTLPVAAHLHTPTLPPAGIDTKKPILLYKTSHVDKIRAESLRPSADGSLVAVGPTLVVPDTYTGWFSIVGSSGCSAICYSSVGQVVKRQPTCFLTRYDVTSYTQSSREGGEGSRPYQRGTVHGGEVLKLLALRRHQEGHEQYAECLNYKKQVVLVPLSATGRFYVTSEKNSHNMEQVYLVSQLVSSFQLPITVRLVCGYMPRTPCAFTGILRLTKCQKESVILACTMTSRADATLLEMDLASNFLLSPVTDPLFSKSPIYLKTLSYCQDEASHWQRQIKVTHHVTERRSRSLTRSFSDKFVDVPLQSQRPLSLSALSSVDRVKPRPSITSVDNRIGRLASKVRKIKQSKRKDAPGKENDAGSVREENDSNLGYKNEGGLKEGQLESANIVCPGTKLFEKHRKLSKQNTYVKEINRKNRPLPDPHENENNKTNSKLTLKESLTSLKKYNKKKKNRPLPNPNEVYSEDEDNLPFLKYKFIKTSRDGIEYCRVLDDTNSPLPESLFEEDTEDEEDTENLYSEIEDYMSSRNDINLSDEEIDSATYSNENSSKENSIDTKMTRTNQGLIKFRERVSRNIEVEAMIHCRARSDDTDMRDELEESDHYATLTIDGEDDDDDDEEEDGDFSCKLSGSKWHRNMKRDLDTISDKSLRSDGMKDSLEDVSAIEPLICSSVKDSDLKTFVADDGTIRKKYIVRQRTTNIYETLEEVKTALKMEEGSSDITPDYEKESNSCSADGNVLSDAEECTPTADQSNLVPDKADVDHYEASQSPYTSMITMVDAENTDWSTSISIQRKPSPVDSSSDANLTSSLTNNRPVLTSSRSIANLCEDEDLTSIQMRGNTILIKVQDDPLSPSVGSAYLSCDDNNGDHSYPESFRSLRKSPSVSSINILLDDNEDERILASGVSHISSMAREKEDGIHRQFPSMVAIAENSGDYGEECNEITYYNDTCLSIAVANMESKDEVFDISSPKQRASRTNTNSGNCPNSSSETIEILSTSNELIITGDSLRRRRATESAEVDSKSVDSGNATDDVNDRDDSFDADSLAGDSEERRLDEAGNPEMRINPDDESDGELSVDFDHFKEASEMQTNSRDVLFDCSSEDYGLDIQFLDPIEEGVANDCSCSRRAPPLHTIPEDDLYSNLPNSDPDLASVSFPSITFPVASTYAFGANTESYLDSIQEESQSLLNTSTESACSTDSKSEVYTPLEPFHSAVMPLSHSEPLFPSASPSCISPTFTSSLITKSSLRKMATLDRSTSASPKLGWGSEAQVRADNFKCFYNSPMSSLLVDVTDASNETSATSMETSSSSCGNVIKTGIPSEDATSQPSTSEESSPSFELPTQAAPDTEPIMNDTHSNSGSSNQIISPCSDVVMQSVQSAKRCQNLTRCKDDDFHSTSSRLNRSPDSSCLSYDCHSTSSSNSELDSSSVLSTSDSGICFIQIK